MDIWNVSTPEGTRDRLFAECRSIREVEAAITGAFAEKGYSEITTPEVEFYDLFIKTGNPLPQESMMKIVDRSGRILVMRPDSTTPIARVAATRLRAAEKPLRLYYNQTVFRSSDEHKGAEREIPQCGIELIGADGVGADVEVLAAAVDALRAAGADDFQIEIGHAGFFRALTQSLGADSETVERIRLLTERKNFAALDECLAPFAGSEAAAALGRLSHLFGGPEVLQEAKELFGGESGKKALEYLAELYAELEKRGYGDVITFDLGLVHQIDYYTGIVFRGYVRGAAANVLSGGRYDRLLSYFGVDCPAIGFAVDTDSLAHSLEISAVKPGERLRIAITKGRLLEKSIEMFERIGLDCTELRNPGRRLVLKVGNYPLDVVMSKAPDVITYVENGVCDMGIVGRDTILENGSSFYEVLDLGFGRCRFALAVKNGEDFYATYRSRRIASKYPNVAKRYFEKKGMDVSVIKIEGSVELAPILDLADAIVDIVETGSTLRANDLVPVETLHEISARLIVNTASMKLHKDRILDFMKKCEAAKDA